MLKSKDLKGWKVSLDFCFIQLSASAETAGTNPGSRQLGQVSQWRQSPTPRCPQNFRLFQKLLHQLMPGYMTDVGQDQKFQSVTTPSSTVCSPLTHVWHPSLCLTPWVLSPHSASSQSVACDEQLFVVGEKKSETDSWSARSAPESMALEIVGNSKYAAQIALS